jgi:hypothetical protein
MRLVADSGLWSTGAPVAPTPLVAVLEVSGAVLSWTVDEPTGTAATQITFTDPLRADWLWRILGESGHLAVTSAVQGRAPEESRTIELAGVDLLPGSVGPLRRLALGHWLRRWWPAGDRDGIAGLDRALLDAEIALLTAAAEEFFTDDTLDSEVGGLLEPHAFALAEHVRGRDPRIIDLVRSCADLAADSGVGGPGWPELSAVVDDSAARATMDALTTTRHRDDYALAAGSNAGPPATDAIARGVGSITWAAVPPGIFDAAENTVYWRIEVAGSVTVAVVWAALSGPDPAVGIAVRLRSGTVSGTGVLDAGGRAVLPLVDAGHRPMEESAAWAHDWPTTAVTIGADLEESAESPQTRERIRRFARARLDRPASDAFLAEILAAELQY